MEYAKDYKLPRQITENTAIAYDNEGYEIKADRLQKWAYRQLDSAFDMYEALKAMVTLIGGQDLPDNGELSGSAICDMARSALTKAEGKNV